MSEQEQRHYKWHPFNIEKGYVDGKLKIEQTALVIASGPNQFIGDSFIFKVDDEPLMSLSLSERGTLELSIALYSKQDNLLALIDKNEWVSGDPFPWDIESSFQCFKLRQRKANISLEIDARKTPVEIRGDLWRKGQHFRLDKQGLLFNGVVKNVGFVHLCFVGMYLLANTQSGTLALCPYERFGQGMFVSEPDVQTRIQKGLEAWKTLRNRV